MEKSGINENERVEQGTNSLLIFLERIPCKSDSHYFII